MSSLTTKALLDLNADRMIASAQRLEMPAFPKERFIDAVNKVVAANAAYVPPYGSGATLYLRPYMFGTNPVIGVKPATECQLRIFATPVGSYFKGGTNGVALRVPDYDRAAPRGTGHVKAGLNYAMSLYPVHEAHQLGYAENLYLDSEGNVLNSVPVNVSKGSATADITIATSEEDRAKRYLEFNK